VSHEARQKRAIHRDLAHLRELAQQRRQREGGGGVAVDQGHVQRLLRRAGDAADVDTEALREARHPVRLERVRGRGTHDARAVGHEDEAQGGGVQEAALLAHGVGGKEGAPHGGEGGRLHSDSHELRAVAAGVDQDAQGGVEQRCAVGHVEHEGLQRRPVVGHRRRRRVPQFCLPARRVATLQHDALRGGLGARQAAAAAAGHPEARERKHGPLVGVQEGGEEVRRRVGHVGVRRGDCLHHVSEQQRSAEALKQGRGLDGGADGCRGGFQHRREAREFGCVVACADMVDRSVGEGVLVQRRPGLPQRGDTAAGRRWAAAFVWLAAAGAATARATTAAAAAGPASRCRPSVRARGSVHLDVPRAALGWIAFVVIRRLARRAGQQPRGAVVPRHVEPAQRREPFFENPVLLRVRRDQLRVLDCVRNELVRCKGRPVEAGVGIFRQQALQEALKRRRDGLRELYWVSHNLLDQRVDVVGVKRRLTVVQLVENAAEGPEVGGVGIRLLLNQLGGHVQRGALNAREHHRVVAHRPSEAEVGELHGPVAAHQNVLGLHVAVNDALAVEVLQGQNELFGDRANLLLRKALVVLKHLEEFSLCVLHHHYELRLSFEGVQQQHDVIVVQLCQDVDFLPKTPQLLFVLALLDDKLHGNHEACPFAPGAVHLAEAALADKLDNVVVFQAHRVTPLMAAYVGHQAHTRVTSSYRAAQSRERQILMTQAHRV
jgi:hypothetical protein